jgi:repressor LexA
LAVQIRNEIMRELTAIQGRVLDFIARAAASGRPPTIREIGAAFRWRSTGTVRDHLRALAAKGAIRWDHGRSRGVAPVWERPSGRDARRARSASFSSGAEAPSHAIPILGRVAAGRPLLAEENLEGVLDVPAATGAGRTPVFALRVQGDSMRDAGILDGDTVVVRKQETARPGEIVVALAGGEATVKRLRREGRRAFLDPANPAYKPIPVEGETRIVGRVVGVWRAV